MDGSSTTRLCDFVLTSLKQGKINHGSSEPQKSLPAPNKLSFVFNSDVQGDIKAAQTAFDKLIGEHDLSVLAFQKYGKGQIKKFNMSPDAFVQMAIQLGYKKTHGESRATYETGMTRQFRHGRTETIRTVSKESVAWVNAMEAKDVNVKTKYELLQKAIGQHISYSGDAVKGHGVDRHFFGATQLQEGVLMLHVGLKKLATAAEAKASIFTDPVFSRSNHWYLSTSQLSSELFQGYGWGEVVEDGYGVAYM